MNLKKFLVKKAKYLGKPYKSEEEKQAYNESYKKARVSALKVKATKEARMSVAKEGILGGLKKMGKKALRKRGKGRKGSKKEKQVVSGLLGTSSGMFEDVARANIPFGLEYTPSKKKSKRKKPRKIVYY